MKKNKWIKNDKLDDDSAILYIAIRKDLSDEMISGQSTLDRDSKGKGSAAEVCLQCLRNSKGPAWLETVLQKAWGRSSSVIYSLQQSAKNTDNVYNKTHIKNL